MNRAPELADFINGLAAFCFPDGGCPYYKGCGPSAEPTLLTLLAFHAAGGRIERTEAMLSWVTRLQNEDGSIGINTAHRAQGLWQTAQAAVVFRHFGLKDPCNRAIDFIGSLKSVAAANDPSVKQDNTLIGWPWVPGTFGWVEPTAWSVIALNVVGLNNDPRAEEGRRLLLDRQIPSGGWNYGNPGLNDRELLPFWDTTGLALIALHGRTELRRVKASLDFLENHQDKIMSLCGLAWAVLGLQSYGRDVGRLKKRLIAVMKSLPTDEINSAHFAAGVIALSGEKVFIA